MRIPRDDAAPGSGLSLLGLLGLGTSWLLAGLVGWLLFHVLGGPVAAGAVAIGIWGLAAGSALVVGLLLGRLWPAIRPRDRALSWAAVAGVGFGFAISAGWTIGVDVGGPATGLAVAAAIAGCDRALPVLRLLPAILIGGAGFVVGRLLLGDRLTVVGLAVTLGCGLVAFGVALTAGRQPVRFRPIALLVAAWGVAWVGSWFVTTRFVDQFSVPLSLAGEIVVAMGLGGLAIAVGWCRRTGERVGVVAARWTGCAAVGYVAAWGIALAVSASGLLSGAPIDHLDAGTVVALPVVVWLAVLPTMRRLGAMHPVGTRAR